MWMAVIMLRLTNMVMVVVLLYGQNVIEQFNGKGHSEDYVTMRNVAGEIIGSEMAIRYAIKHGYQFICIYYDYEGMGKWFMESQ